MQVLPNKVSAADTIVDRILPHKSDYQTIEKTTGVPWFLVAAIHYREGNLDFNTYLGNGQSLTKPTTEVPIGRGPFTSFVEGAVDSLQIDGLDKVGTGNWDISRCLYEAEAFNGFGYIKENINSPYVWSYSNLYTSGKYVGDHDFNATSVDEQCGVAVILNRLAFKDNSVQQAISVPISAMPIVPAQQPAPVVVAQPVKPASTTPPWLSEIEASVEDSFMDGLAQMLRSMADSVEKNKPKA